MKMNRILIASAILVGLMSAASFAQSPSDPAAPSQAPPTQTAPPQAAPPPAAPQSPAAPATAPATAPTGANQAANPTQSTGAPRIAAGSVIPVQLTKTIDAKKAKPGDEVVATVTMDLKTNSGEVVVPKNTKVVGHVTESQARSKDQKESQVAITFDHAVVKGTDMNLPMSIQAVIAPPSNDQNSSGGGANSGNGQAAPTGGGGAAQSPMNGGRTSSGQTQPPSASSDNAPNGASDTAQQAGNARPQITGNTKGVVGISNLTLAAGENATQGSVLSSEKNNVKVESGTMLLLKVNQ
jgi:hypothetical protein